MKLTDSQLSQASASTDPLIRALYEHYIFVTSNDVYESYVARKILLNKWNAELIENPVSILSTPIGKLDDLDAASKTDKEVDRVLKFLEKQPMLIEGSQKFLDMFTTEEEVMLNKDKRIKDSEDRAFKAKTA